MSSGILAGLFLAHGFITTTIGVPAIAEFGRRAWTDPGVANAAWLAWWPTNLGRSWLVDLAQAGPTGYLLGGVVWALAGLAFGVAGLGLLGVPGLRDVWQPLAVAGGGLGLVAAALFFHPWYVLALLINLAVIVTRAGVERSPFLLAGS